MGKNNKPIGLAIIGCGTIGRIRAEFARDYPGIGWHPSLRAGVVGAAKSQRREAEPREPAAG